MNSKFQEREQIERLKRVYFSDPSKQFILKKGEILVDQGKKNNWLCLVLSGCLVGNRHIQDETNQESGRSYEMFRSEAGTFVCVQSFFSQTYVSFSKITALTDTKIAYIDTDTKAVEPEKYGSLFEQFVPTMIYELAIRNIRVLERATEKEQAIHRLHRTEMNATLGQLAAGLSHELNNAVGVLVRKTDFISQFLEEFLQNTLTEEYPFFNRGKNFNEIISSTTLREKAYEYEKRFKLSQTAAKVLAKMAPNEKAIELLPKKSLKKMEYFSHFWELGRDIHDLRVAADHASSIVKSVRVLGGNQFQRNEGINIHETLSFAIALLKSNLRNVTLQVYVDKKVRDLTIFGDVTELVQIWVNIIKNSCDAMTQAKTPNPTVTISYTADNNFAIVSIADNGPGIPEKLQSIIFNPDFTTKKNGLSFGLGLGLAIVQRLVESYNGKILLDSAPGNTIFKIKLPIENTYGNH